MSSMSQDAFTIDILSVIFFLIAGVWLLAALCYSLLVLCFMRMRSNGQLGSIYDENFGRVQLPFGDGWYIPMGCIFRRYARHLNLDDGERRNVRYFTRAERRAAMEILLLSETAHMNTSTSKLTTAVTALQRCMRHCNNALPNTVKSASNDAVLATPVAVKTRRVSDIEACADTDSNDNDELSETGPICSICLGEFDVDSDIERVFVAKTCTHQFHETCIMAWLQRQSNTECPCCRVPMVHEDDVWATVKRLRREKRKRLQQQTKNSQGKKKRASIERKQNERNTSSSTVDSTEHETAEDGSEVDA